MSTPISTTVVRCGQMSGGISGAWNEHEWFPSLVKSSVTLGKLPSIDSVCFMNSLSDYKSNINFNRWYAGSLVPMPVAQSSISFAQRTAL